MEEIKRNYESECESDLEKDDSVTIQKRYEKFIKQSFFDKEKAIDKKPPPRLRMRKAQWPRYYDVVQEHYSSHVMVNQSTYLLPKNICALKQEAKQSWMLYKKRECERRKRLRLKIVQEREKEQNGNPSNLLLTMVDACEVCKKLYVTVNLFWGITLCDICYFNEEVIHSIMKINVDKVKKVKELELVKRSPEKKINYFKPSDEVSLSPARPSTYIPSFSSKYQKIIGVRNQTDEESSIQTNQSCMDELVLLEKFDSNFEKENPFDLIEDKVVPFVNGFSSKDNDNPLLVQESEYCVDKNDIRTISKYKKYEKEEKGMSPKEKEELLSIMDSIDIVYSPKMYFEVPMNDNDY